VDVVNQVQTIGFPDGHALRECLRALVAELLGTAPASIDINTRFRELGLKSAQLVSFVATLSARIDRSLTATLPWEYPTLETLAVQLEALGAPTSTSCARSGRTF
jgi:acyl carrier protein